MTASTTDRATTMRLGQTRSGVLLAAALVFAGCMVCRDSNGEITDGEDAAGLQFAGIAREGVDNADDGESVEYYVEGEFLLAATGITEADVGKAAYLIDNQTVGLADDVAHGIRVGVIAGVESSTQVWVRIDADKRPEPRQYTVQVTGSDTAALDLTAAAADFGGSDFHVTSVQDVEAFVTATGASDGLRAETTDYTVGGGAITTTADETANTWRITFTGGLL